MITRQKDNGKWELYCRRYNEAAWGPDGQPLEFETQKAATLFDNEHPDLDVCIEEENELYDDEENWSA